MRLLRNKHLRSTQGRAWFLWLVLQASCTLVLRRDRDQCGSDADCQARGSLFRDTICKSDHLCDPRDQPPHPPDGPDGGPPLLPDAALPPRMDVPLFPGDAGLVDASGPCNSNSDCIPAGVPSLCRDHICLPLDALSCSSAGLGGVADNAVPVGILTRTHTPADLKKSTSIIGAVGTAFSEIDGFVAGANWPKAFPLVGIACDEEDPDSVSYLIDRLKVRTILGPSSDLDLQKVLGRTKPQGIVLLSPTSDDPATWANPTGGGLFWSCKANRARRASSFAKEITQAASLLQAAHPKELTPLKVAVAFGDDPATSAFLELVKTSLASSSLAVVRYVSWQSNGFKGSYAELAASVLALGANVVVAGSDADPWEDVIRDVDLAYASAAPNKVKPAYVIAGKSEGVIGLALQDTTRSLPQRIVALGQEGGIVPSTLGRGVLLSVPNTRRSPEALPTTESDYAYDCAYVAAYGLMGASMASDLPPESISGVGFRAVMAKLNPPGELEVVGTDDLPYVLSGLVAKDPAVADPDLGGVSGALDFDLDRGSPTDGTEIYCIDPVYGYCGTGVVITAAAVATGLNRCPCP